MSNVMNFETMILMDIESDEFMRTSFERYSGITIDNEIENNLISTYLTNRKSPEWAAIRKAIYYYAFYFLNSKQTDHLAEVLADTEDDGFKYMELDPMIESTILTLMIHNYVAEVTVINGKRSKLFSDVNRWIVDLSFNDMVKAKPFIKRLERFAYSFFKRFNAVDLEDVVKPILENTFTK